MHRGKREKSEDKEEQREMGETGSRGDRMLIRPIDDEIRRACNQKGRCVTLKIRRLTLDRKESHKSHHFAILLLIFNTI